MYEPMDVDDPAPNYSNDVNMTDFHEASNIVGATLRKCFLSESKIEIDINGYEFIQKHKLLFARVDRNSNETDSTTASIFQFPRDPFQKVYAVGATYKRRNLSKIRTIQGKIYSVKHAKVLFKEANEQNMTSARIELEDRGDKFQYFFGPCPENCEYIEVEFVLGKTMQRALPYKEIFQSCLPLHVGRSIEDLSRTENYRHSHRFIEDIIIRTIYGTKENIKLSAAVDDQDVFVELKAKKDHHCIGGEQIDLGGEQRNEYEVKFLGARPTISQSGQYSAILNITVDYDKPSNEKSPEHAPDSKKYAERVRIDRLPNNYGNILSFDISPKLVKDKLKKLKKSEKQDTTPRQLTFFIDRSGTMTGQPLREAVSGTLLLLRSVLRENDSFKIVSVGSNTQYLELNNRDEFTIRDLDNDQNQSAVEIEMNRFTANMNETKWHEPIEIAINRRIKNKKRIFILISDGLFGRPRRAQGNPDENPAAFDFKRTKMLIEEEATRAETGAFRFFAVGIGRNSSQMGCDELARAGKGSFVHVPLRHRLQSEMLKLGDHIQLDHYELTDIKLKDTEARKNLPVFPGPGLMQTENVLRRQWGRFGLGGETFNHLVENGYKLNKFQSLLIYDNNRVHYHVPDLSPKELIARVNVEIEINFEHKFGFDLSDAVTCCEVEDRLRSNDAFFPLKSYGYQQSAFLSSFNPPIPEINKYDLHTEFALKTQILVFKKTSYGWFDMTAEQERTVIEEKERQEEEARAREEARREWRPMEIPEISAQNYDQYFGSGRQQQGFAHHVQVGGVGGRPQGGDYAGGNQGVPGQRRPTFGKPPPAGGASAMRKHRKQNKYGVRYQNTILPKPTYIPEDKNFTPLLLQADRTWIWRSKQQTWEQIRKYLAFEEDIHPPMLVKELFKPNGKFTAKFRFSRGNEAQERDDVIVTLFVYAIFEKCCERKRDIWSRYWRNTLATMNSKFGAKEEDVKALKQEILQFIHKKGMLLPERY